MKKVISFFGSIQSAAVLMLVFAFAIGYATIIENDFGTQTAKAEIYNAAWFEWLLILLGINLVYNIFRYKMYTKKKLPVFIFHISFIVILVGAAITRYVGFEGSMHIREGQSSAYIVSMDNYFILGVKKGEKESLQEYKVFLSSRSKNNFDATLNVANTPVEFSLVRYIPNAIEKVLPAKDGKPYLEMMVTGNGGGTPVALARGEFYDAGSYVIDFESNQNFDKPTVKIFLQGDKLFMSHPFGMNYFRMADRASKSLIPAIMEPLEQKVLYSSDYGNFVVRNFLMQGRKELQSQEKKAGGRMMMNASKVDGFVFKIKTLQTTKEVTFLGRSGSLATLNVYKIGDLEISLGYGAKKIFLPFAIYLKDFKMERYPGSMSPSSYESDVILIDEKDGVKMPYRIYMNHILEYKGYRFFQSSYDPDEKGTILSVNHDPGTIWAYVGYILLGLGMFWSLFARGLRFEALRKKAQKARDAKEALVGLALVVMMAFSPTIKADDTLQKAASIDKKVAKEFGALVVQDAQGRMKPVDTLTLEIFAKIYRGDHLEIAGKTLDTNQIVLGMMVRPDLFKSIKMIRTANKYVNKALGLPEDTKYASFDQFFEDPKNLKGYKLFNDVEAAAGKPQKERNKYDKEVLKVDERLNVAYMVFNGSLIKIWPKPNDPNNKWVDTLTALQTFPQDVAQLVRNIAVTFFTSVDAGIEKGEWDHTFKALHAISLFQKQYGKAVYPSEDRIKAEIFYNHAGIFETIYPIYLLVGFILLILSFIKIVKPNFGLDGFAKLSFYILVVLFIAHTIGLALRWYISGHAPWSNGYESMIYIGWASVLAGFIFSKKSPITLAATGILTGLILFVAHLNWMNPQVTNLVPVLNSYWLSIHVSMITASYGFLGLGALLGFITLILYIVKKGKNEKIISYSIIELNAINEMSLMIGLAMLTVGNFLGGVWANESWGRYWGWDPKETWALVTILVYAVVVHLRFIKKIYNEFNYAVISLLAFTSVIMTYFGVNYYLAGLHSYAKGDPVPIPDFVPVSYGIIFIVIALAYRNRKLEV